MWDPRKETTAQLEAYVARQPLGRMEAAYIDAARQELERRKKEQADME